MDKQKIVAAVVALVVALGGLWITLTGDKTPDTTETPAAEAPAQAVEATPVATEASPAAASEVTPAASEAPAPAAPAASPAPVLPPQEP